MDETGEEVEDVAREETTLEPVFEGELDGEPDDGADETGEVVEAREERVLEPVFEGEFEGEPDDG